MASNPKSIALPIAAAEGISTLVSLGAVIAMSHWQERIEPLRNFVARHFVYPVLRGKPAAGEIDTTDPLFQKAHDKASLLVKGAGMIGAGFASHIPIQLALEGHFDVKSLKHTVAGKGAGVAVALGSILLLNKMTPNILPSVQCTICPVIDPYLSNGCKNGNCNIAEETCHLMTVDIPSSIISGLINYSITRQMLRSR